MEKRQLGRTEVYVSKLCLGTMTWGEQNSQKDGFAQMDRAFEAGINFFDTAEMYPVPPKAETYGATERIIGEWFKANPLKREQIILASKVAAPGNNMTHIRGGKPSLNRANIEQALNDSLTRLNTDYVDLYQLHWPDRVTNFFGKLGYSHKPEYDGTPLLETLEALSDLVKAGKIRHIGLSNETAWGVMHALNLSETKNLARVASIQNPYNLLNRSFEVGLAEVAHREDVGLLAYSPLAFGMLTGKYDGGARPEGARISLFSRFSRYTHEQSTKTAEKYNHLAREHGLTPAQMALAFVTQQAFVTSNIIGATTMAQLEENLSTADTTLSTELIKAIEAIHTAQPNPAP